LAENRFSVIETRYKILEPVGSFT